MEQYAAQYPDVVRAGSLRAALQAEADRGGHRLEVVLRDESGWWRIGAKATAGGRTAYVLMTTGPRCFVVDCTAAGAGMASGTTDDLAAVAGSVADWIAGPPVRQFVARRPFLRTWDLAEAIERGDPVPARWKSLRAAADPRGAAFRDFVEAAHAEPRLRALSPGRSMYRITFSRRAVEPICHDLPMVHPRGEDRYRIRHGPRRDLVLDVTGTANAVAAVLALLPADAVPARHEPLIRGPVPADPPGRS